MKAFKISGTFNMGLNVNQPFAKEMVADNKTAAREKALSDIGSRHNIKRRLITIKKIDELKPEEITDPIIKDLVSK
jgi:large subunit ribosomal protein LX